jgi:hypothetical protein
MSLMTNNKRSKTRLRIVRVMSLSWSEANLRPAFTAAKPPKVWTLTYRDRRHQGISDLVNIKPPVLRQPAGLVDAVASSMSR